MECHDTSNSTYEKTFNLHAKIIHLDFKNTQQGKIIQYSFVDIIQPDKEEYMLNYFCKSKLVRFSTPSMRHLQGRTIGKV